MVKLSVCHSVPNVCTGVQIPPGQFFCHIANDAGKAHVSCLCNISEFKFGMGYVRITVGRVLIVSILLRIVSFSTFCN